MTTVMANMLKQTLWTSSEAETSAAGQAEAPKEELEADGWNVVPAKKAGRK